MVFKFIGFQVRTTLVNVASLPSDADIAPEWDAFIASVQRPATQARIKKLLDQGFHQAGDVENRLGHYVGQLGEYLFRGRTFATSGKAQASQRSA